MSLSNFFYPTSLSIQLSRNKFFQMTFLSNDFIRRNFYQTASSRRIFIKWHHRNDFLSNVFIETIFHHRLESSSKRHFIKRFYQNDFSSKDFNWNDFFSNYRNAGKVQSLSKSVAFTFKLMYLESIFPLPLPQL